MAKRWAVHWKQWQETLHRYIRVAGVAVLFLVAFMVGRYWANDEVHEVPSNSASEVTTGREANHDEIHKPVAYTCPMHPHVRMPDADDKCPICFMSLVPVPDANRVGNNSSAVNIDRAVMLSESAMALIKVQTVPVIRRAIQHRVAMVGKIEYDETRLAYITAYAKGRLDRLYVDYTGITVRAGDHLAEIYSPDLLVAMQELVEAKRMDDRLSGSAQRVGSNNRSGVDLFDAKRSIVASTRDRLRLMGLTDDQINAAEHDGVVNDHMTLFAPIGGVVIEKHAKVGSYVAVGDRIFTIADLSQVWVVLEAYETDLPWLRYGQSVTFTTQAYGDELFHGKIAFIDSVFDEKKRTVRVRVNVENTSGRLRPGMFVRANVMSSSTDIGLGIAPGMAGKWVAPMHPEIVRDEPGDCPVCGMALVRAEDLGYGSSSNQQEKQYGQQRLPLVIPESAVLRTGERGVVYVMTTMEQGAKFEGREITLGAHGEGFFVVRSGLSEGEQVVTRGNFQIDSALQIQSKPSMMNPDRFNEPSGYHHE